MHPRHLAWLIPTLYALGSSPVNAAPATKPTKAATRPDLWRGVPFTRQDFQAVRALVRRHYIDPKINNKMAQNLYRLPM